jgi:hypothetical protein
VGAGTAVEEVERATAGEALCANGSWRSSVLSYTRPVRRLTLCPPDDPEADALLTNDPRALLTGVVLHQQVLLERACRGSARSISATAPRR